MGLQYMSFDEYFRRIEKRGQGAVEHFVDHLRDLEWVPTTVFNASLLPCDDIRVWCIENLRGRFKIYNDRRNRWLEIELPEDADHVRALMMAVTA